MEDSPFTQISTYTLSIEPYLNTYSKQYQNIITIDKVPAGPLAQMVSHFNSPKLSPFQSTNFPNHNLCKYGIRRNYNTSACREDYFLTADDVPSLLGYLTTNGYTIDTSITKIIHKSNIPKKVVCVVSYTTI